MIQYHQMPYGYQGNTYQPLRRLAAGYQSAPGTGQDLERSLIQNDSSHPHMILENVSLNNYTCMKIIRIYTNSNTTTMLQQNTVEYPYL